MKLTLRQQLTQFSNTLQSQLFPILKNELGELSSPAKRLVATLEMIPLARFIPTSRGWIGRPSKDRLAIANAFVAKSVYGFSLTRQLLDASKATTNSAASADGITLGKFPTNPPSREPSPSSPSWNSPNSYTRL